ncbi:acyl carrier protein [Vibrio diabolicus]|uniref:acyl carrier protein n=1 Tax=Vibrio TaxID=662 RepID=UPI00111FB614|nr:MULTISPECIES: acyl carrier protein [Vibrio]ELB2759613.1 acyl carrier protein [Vibrio alginolyticus]ELP3325868.1 acyl carrier protein [Vibrio alginolyticus]ELU8567435.1 acyl carrier protein [Vibrio alginolyticus]MBS9914499.1 acyl carrier protein [Vibrio alginolyticus]MBS9950521.1 acyl carrier protein [Vibrio alginolyticus]
MEQFKEHLIEILDIEMEELDMDSEFSEMESWDSLAQLSFIAMAQDEYDVNVSHEQLKNAKTFTDLHKLVLNG